ncbi:MAG: sigma-54 dependent transcriptional regulator [Phycisphaerae bacterium]
MLLQIAIAVTGEKTRRRLRALLRQQDAVIHVVKGRTDLWGRAADKSPDVILIDQEALEAAIEEGVTFHRGTVEAPAVVAVSDGESASERAALIAAGCEAVLFAGLDEPELAGALEAILEQRRAALARDLSRRPLAEPRLRDFVSESPTMQAFMEMVHRVVPGQTALLILGETGVGKERLARAVHAEGPRAGGPFVAVNCGALPEALLESELFGHEEGAFTGATRTRRGAFELAHGGTIFLDEVGDMPPPLQVKLLRVLQDYEVQRVGAERPFIVDVRVMAASNRDLEADAEAGRFRRDLFYRLSVVSLTVPPLRERVEDIPTLAQSYVEYHRPRVGRDVRGISDEALEALRRYGWPGNVRELINVVERAMLLCRGDTITPADLPASIRDCGPRSRPVPAVPREADEVPPEWLDRPLKEVRGAMVADMERAYLAAMLRATGGKVGEAARRAGLDPRSLYEKMQQYGLAKEAFKP